MLGKIQNSDYDVKTFMTKVKNKEDGVRLMGFGHRVYKNYDPRAAIIKKTADEIIAKLGGDDEMLDIAKGLEEIALNDDYFIERKLYPNVDFYTGLIYKAMGFPTKMFTVLFALGRAPGWIAQWREMMEDPETKIGRPRRSTSAPPSATTRRSAPAEGRRTAGRRVRRVGQVVRSTTVVAPADPPPFQPSASSPVPRVHRCPATSTAVRP